MTVLTADLEGSLTVLTAPGRLKRWARSRCRSSTARTRCSSRSLPRRPCLRGPQQSRFGVHTSSNRRSFVLLACVASSTSHEFSGWRRRRGTPPALSTSCTPPARKVDVRLHGKGNSTSHGARPVHLIITMIKWIRTSRFSMKNSLSTADGDGDEVHHQRCRHHVHHL